MSTLTWLVLVPMMACNDGGTDTDQPPGITGGTNTESCGGTAPLADSLIISNGGVKNFEGEDAPTIGLSLHLTDEDGDLHKGTMEIWFDTNLDESVDSDVEPDADRIYSELGEACFVDEVTLNLGIRVGTVFEYNTPYEFAALFIDGNGVASNTLIASGVTPKEDGSDGDPLD